MDDSKFATGRTRTVVYILSTGRTGSTVLDMVLGSHQSCHSLGEFKSIKQFGLGDVSNRCRFCDNTCDFWLEFSEICRPPFFHEAAFNASKKSFLIDSSKDISWLVDSMQNTQAKFKVVHMTRSLLDSFQKEKRKSRRNGGCDSKISVAHIISSIRNNEKIDLFLDTLPDEDVISTRYEDLVSDPVSVVSRICNFIGLEYREEMLQYYKFPHHILKGSNESVELIKYYQGKMPFTDLHFDTAERVNKCGYDLLPKQNDPEMFSPREHRIVQSFGTWWLRRYGYIEKNLKIDFSYFKYRIVMPFVDVYYIFARRIIKKLFASTKV